MPIVSQAQIENRIKTEARRRAYECLEKLTAKINPIIEEHFDVYSLDTIYMNASGNLCMENSEEPVFQIIKEFEEQIIVGIVDTALTECERR